MKKLKIASLFESIIIGGGVEKIQANLSIGLTDLGYEFSHILLKDKEYRNEHKGKIISLGENFILGFGLQKIISLFRIAWKVKKVCAQEKIDVLIGQGDFFFMVSGLSKIFGNKSKIIAVVHTSIGIWKNFVIIVMIFFLRIHDHIVMTSAHEMQTFIKKYKFPIKKLSLIYNAIDIEKVIVLSNNIVSSERSWLFENGRKNFVNIGRLNYQKNQQLLIRAFAKVKDKNTQLIIIGGGNEQKNLEQLISDLDLQNRVFLIGNQQNPHAFIARSDYRILSSRFEGFPVVFIEGGLFAKPMIAVDCPTGPREFLDPSSKIGTVESFAIADHGILVRFDEINPEYLQQAIEYVLIHTLDEQQSNVQSYCKQFDNKINAKQRDTLIQSLV